MSAFSRTLLASLSWLLLCFACSSSAMALQHPFFSKNKAAEKKLEKLLQAARIKPLEYQPAGLSLSLQKLDGSKISLETLRGKVLLLTRWATWCGACRSELPSKVLLQQQFKHPRFAVVGISTESAETVKKYQATAKASYRNSFLDPEQVTQRFFPGGGIPVTVLVDAWGWVLGIRKGAGPWANAPVKALLRYLLSIAPSLKSLQEKVPAPTAHFPKTLRAKAGNVFELPIRLNWNGEQDKYPRIGFRLPSHKHLTRAGLRISGIQEDRDGNQRTYVLRLRAKQPGTIQLKPLLMNFWLKDNENHYQSNIGAVTLVIAGNTPVNSRTQSNKEFAIMGLLVAFGLLIVFVLVALRQKKKNQTVEGPALFDEDVDKRQQTMERLLEDSLLRLENYATEPNELAFVEEIFWIRTEILDQDASALEALGEALRYGGESLPAGDGETLLRELVRDLEPDFPNQSERVRDIQTRAALP